MTVHTRRVLLTWLAVVALLVVGAAAAWRVRRDRLSRALVDDVLASANAVRPRPVVVGPSVDGGSARGCALAVEARQPKLVWFGASPPDAGVTVGQVLRGERDAAALPAGVWTELDAHLAWAEELVACAQLESPRSPGEYLAADPKSFVHTQPQKLLAADGLRALDGGVPSSLRRCAQVVALGAETSAKGLVGAMLGVHAAKIASPWCARAIRAAQPEALEPFEGQLLRARQAFWPYADTLRTERDVMLLSLFRESLTPEQYARLPARFAADLADWGLSYEQPLLARWITEAAWPTLAERFEEQIAAAAEPAPTQAARFAAIAARKPSVWEQLPPLSLFGSDYGRFAERKAQGDEVLEQLIALTQARLGKPYDGPSRTLTVDAGVIGSALPGVAPLPLREPSLDAGPR